MPKYKEWLAWQKAVIREEYKDISFPREQVEKQFRRTVKESMNKCKEHVNG